MQFKFSEKLDLVDSVFLHWVNCLGLIKRDDMISMQQAQIPPSFPGLWSKHFLISFLKCSILVLISSVVFHVVLEHIL